MERHFEEELSDINKDLSKMASLSEEAIFKAVEALKNRDPKLANDVIESDKLIDELENVIEEKSLTYLALRQPLAADLRFITTGMKINAELERIADLAVDIAQRVAELLKEPPLKPLIDIPRLSEIAQRMVSESIESFIRKDVELAKKVLVTDPEADNLRDKVQSELIHDYMEKDAKTATRAVPLLLIARFLERICDHATNIAEDVIYMVQARVIKHHLEELKNENKDGSKN